MRPLRPARPRGLLGLDHQPHHGRLRLLHLLVHVQKACENNEMSAEFADPWTMTTLGCTSTTHIFGNLMVVKLIKHIIPLSTMFVWLLLKERESDLWISWTTVRLHSAGIWETFAALKNCQCRGETSLNTVNCDRKAVRRSKHFQGRHKQSYMLRIIYTTCVQSWEKVFVRGCEKFLPGPAWLLLSKTY